MNSTHLPTAIIIGAQKCGTTTLFNTLCRHSEIEPPRHPTTHGIIKECDFFSSDEAYSHGNDWYASFFIGEPRCYIEASPSYISAPRCFGRIREVVPRAKLIVCLRNPIARAYSQYNHYRQQLPQSAGWDWDHRIDFLENLEIERERPVDFKVRFRGLLQKGIYVGQLKRLLEHFDRSQIYVSVMERWRHDFAAEVARIQRFLGLEVEPFSPSIHHRRRYTVEPLGKEAKALLAAYYKPHNEELFEFLGHDIPEWNEAPASRASGAWRAWLARLLRARRSPKPNRGD